MPFPRASQALSRFTVLDLTRVRAGPTCARQLADWGASVIKVESPEGDAGMGGERHGPDFQNLHRNKRSMTLNLKSPEGVDILKRLVREADVFSQGYRPGTLGSRGLSPEELAALRPGLVYVSLCAFSHAGPWASRRGFDSAAVERIENLGAAENVLRRQFPAFRQPAQHLGRRDDGVGCKARQPIGPGLDAGVEIEEAQGDAAAAAGRAVERG